jgi:VWFA-related protein
MKTCKVRLSIAALILAIAAPASNPAAQTKSGQESVQNPHHEVSVSLKLLQVYVMDKSGNSVPGLKPADFEITDDGKPVSITDFEFHAAVIPGIASDSSAAVPSAEPAKLSRKFFLWYDFGFNDPKGAKRAKTAGLHFLDSQIRPEDEVALLTSTSVKGLTVQEYLTKDHLRVRKDIEALDAGRIVGRASEIEQLMGGEQEWARWADPGKPPINNPDANKGAATEEAAKELVRAEGAFAQLVYKQQSLKFLRDFKDMAKSLRYIPGAKSLVLFSGGIARALLFGMKGTPEAQTESDDAVLIQFGDRDVQNEFHDLVRELRASNTFIYAVNGTLPQGAAHDPAFRDFQGDEFLRQLAGETGGQYFHNTQDTNKAVEDIQKFTASYYVLGYPVSQTRDGRYHAVKIAVKRKDLRCWGTAGYFNPKPFGEYTATEKHLHLIELALSDDPQGQKPGEISFKAVPVYLESGPRLAILGLVSHDPGEPMFGPKTEALAILFDEQKNIKGIKRTDLTIRGVDGDRIFLSGLLPIQPGAYTFRIVLRDLDSGRSARAAAVVNIPAPSFAGLTVSSPLWLAAEKGARWKGAFSKEIITAAYPFDQGAYVPILEDLHQDTEKIFGVLPVSFYGAVRPEISLAAQIVDLATGNRRSLVPTVLSKTEGDRRDVYFIELTTGPQSSGGYSVYLFVQDKAGFKKAFISSYKTR